MPHRVFIDWSQPFLPEVARRLIAMERSHGGAIDLSGRILMTPGARAGRLSLHELVEAATEAGQPLIPPRAITPGSFAEVLAASGPPIATKAERLLAWFGGLRQARAEVIRPLLTQVPAPQDQLAWLEIAGMLQALDEEIRGEGLSYDAIIETVELMGVAPEAERWRSVALLHHIAQGQLTRAGLHDPDEVLRAIAEAPAIVARRDWVLIGITELPSVHAELLRSLERCGAGVVSFIHAPESRAESFDDLGCVLREAWQREHLDFDDEDLFVVDRPCDQVQGVLAAIAGFEGSLSAEEIAVGLGDEKLGPSLRRAASRAGIDVHLATGVSLRHSRPATLLSCIADWVSERSFSRLAAVVRHRDAESLLREQAREVDEDFGDHLCHLDRLHSKHLYERLDNEAMESSPRTEAVSVIDKAVTSLASPLLGQTRTLGSWMGAVIELLHRVYGRVEIMAGEAQERELNDACRAIVEVCADTARLASPLQFECGGAEAVRYVLSQLAELSRPQAIRAGQVEALGWLELRFDPARAVILTGVNEGLIPSSISADAFLPDLVRAQLGLRHNASRYARDLYALEAMRQSRQRVIAICGRRNDTGEPLAPSRFLLAGDDRSLPQRVLRLSGGSAATFWNQPLGWPSPAAASQFARPRAPQGPLDLPHISVTQFKRYLECPFRFWLACVRGLALAGDEFDELDPFHFGSLAHEVLRDFGSDESIRDTADATAIAAYLESRVRAVVADRFGPRPMATVRVQAARLRQRLESFARLQASLRQRGWRIQACELSLPDSATIDIENDRAMPVSATIDRVDVHDDLGVRLIDYKTGEAGEEPRTTHGPTREGEWLDLQLPMYHHLYCRFVDGAIASDRVELAYITLPKKPEDVDLIVAGWSRDELESAMQCAREVVMGIRAGKFEPRDVRPERDPFAIICQTTSFASGEDERSPASMDF